MKNTEQTFFFIFFIAALIQTVVAVIFQTLERRNLKLFFTTISQALSFAQECEKKNELENKFFVGEKCLFFVS